MDSNSVPAFGVNLDRTLATEPGDLVDLGIDAVQLGCRRLWVAARSFDPFEIVRTLSLRIVEADLEPPHLGIPVISMTDWSSPSALVSASAAMTSLTNGRFAFGVGVGHPRAEASRYGEQDARPLAFAEEYLTAVRGLMRDTDVDGASSSIEVRHAGTRPTPVYLGALGPGMLRLGGRLADGVVLNWATADHVEWSRMKALEGADQVGRPHSEIRVLTQVRVCISDDVESARSILARQLVAMTLRSPIEPADRGYRAHIGRLGYGDLFADLAEMKQGGATADQLAARVPPGVLDTLGYAGPPDGAASAVSRLASGADEVILRVVPSGRSGIGFAHALSACMAPFV
jgi:alkanesulfonate monooxygenase SsuD/methylene tetrahydromethanopterin reductase-like flavin-dependent oxidoreductase (luciferase family)